MLLGRLAELARHRDLLTMLVVRDLKTRYRGSVLGWLWTLLNPLLLFGIFYLVFTAFARFDRPHYALELLLGILLWNLVGETVNTSIYSLVGNASLIKKVYLPLEVFPLAVAAGTLVNFLCALPVLVLFSLGSGVFPGVGWLWLPIAALLLALLAGTLGLLVAPLAVHFKDTNHFVPVLLQLGFFASPVLYPLAEALPRLPEWARALYLLNPYAVWVTVARSGLLGEPLPAGLTPALGVTLLVTVAIALVCGAVFNRLRPRLAEYL